jgi:hypothetical protein
MLISNSLLLLRGLRDIHLGFHESIVIYNSNENFLSWHFLWHSLRCHQRLWFLGLTTLYHSTRLFPHVTGRTRSSCSLTWRCSPHLELGLRILKANSLLAVHLPQLHSLWWDWYLVTSPLFLTYIMRSWLHLRKRLNERQDKPLVIFEKVHVKLIHLVRKGRLGFLLGWVILRLIWSQTLLSRDGRFVVWSQVPCQSVIGLMINHIGCCRFL